MYYVLTEGWYDDMTVVGVTSEEAQGQAHGASTGRAHVAQRSGAVTHLRRSEVPQR